MSSVKSFINFENKYDRVIVLVDMDCFYCQVEEKLNPELKGKPIAVVQHNEWQGGGIIAVNYPARAAGVSRHMRGAEAKEHCPEIVLCRVPKVREKADLTKYRDAGKEVAQVLQTFTPLLERASVDEAYLDITDSVIAKLKEMNAGNYKLDASKFGGTHAVGYENFGDFVQDLTKRCASTCDDDGPRIFENESEYERTSFKRSDLKLLIGAAIVNEIRAAVKEKTGYECSAGIAHNKILAKLTAGMHKPNKQTVLPVRSIPELYATLPITKVKGLGGKFGEEVCEAFKIKFMSQLATIPKEQLMQRFDEKNGNWLYLISRGVDLEHVTPRYTAKSIACCKRFPGKNAILGIASLNHWLSELASEICERMEKDTMENNRKAKQMVVSYTQTIGSEDISSSRTVPLNYYESQLIAREALEVIKRNTSQFFKADNPGTLNNQIKFLGISVSKFEDQTKSDTLKEMFKNQRKKANPVQEPAPSTSKESEDETTGQSSATTLGEIMSRRKKSTAIESITKPEEAPTPQRKSNSLLESLFAKQKKKTESQSDEVDSISKVLESTEACDEIIEAEMSSIEPKTSEVIEECEPSTSNNEAEEEEDIILPEIEIPLIPCEICKRKIPEDEMSAHNDYHFALQLSQQQREEFRNEIKSKFSSATPNKPKTVVIKSNKSNTLPSIQSFLKKKEDHPEEIDDEDAIKCEECGKMVRNIIEHSDYHLAKKLQQEFSRAPSQTTQTSIGTKRKRSNSRSDKTNPVKIKPLTTFFSKAE